MAYLFHTFKPLLLEFLVSFLEEKAPVYMVPMSFLSRVTSDLKYNSHRLIWLCHRCFTDLPHKNIDVSRTQIIPGAIYRQTPLRDLVAKRQTSLNAPNFRHDSQSRANIFLSSATCLIGQQDLNMKGFFQRLKTNSCVLAPRLSAEITPCVFFSLN